MRMGTSGTCSMTCTPFNGHSTCSVCAGLPLKGGLHSVQKNPSHYRDCQCSPRAECALGSSEHVVTNVLAEFAGLLAEFTDIDSGRCAATAIDVCAVRAGELAALPDTGRTDE